MKRRARLRRWLHLLPRFLFGHRLVDIEWNGQRAVLACTCGRVFWRCPDVGLSLAAAVLDDEQAFADAVTAALRIEGFTGHVLGETGPADAREVRRAGEDSDS